MFKRVRGYLKGSALFAILLLIGFLLGSCDLGLKSNAPGTVLLGNFSVKLKGSLEPHDLKTSSSDILDKLVAGRSSEHARNILGSDDLLNSGIDYEGINKTINKTIKEYDFPKFTNDGVIDFAGIKNDFPGLDESEIQKNYSEILAIYYSELCALSLNDIMNRLTSQYTSGKGLYDYSIQFDNSNLTLYEIVACLRHPISALSLLTTRQVAFDLESQEYGSSGNGDNQADAFRHSSWNILLARYGFQFKGEKLSWAEDFTTAHEQGIKYSEKTSEMDLHNNKTGRMVYDMETNMQYTQILWWSVETGVGNEPSNDRIIELMKPKADAAALVSIDLPLSTVQSLVNSVDAGTLVYLRP